MENKKMCGCGERGCECGGCATAKGGCCDWAIIPLRLVVALVFIAHGYGKLTGGGVGPGMDGFIGMLTGLDVPLPVVAAWGVALVEFVGGIGILIGLFTRVWAGLLAVNMVVAYLLVKTKMPFPVGEIDLAMLAINLSLLGLGAGCFSLDAWFKCRRKETQGSGAQKTASQ